MNFYVKKRDVWELIEYTELERDKNMLRYLYKDSDELLHIFTTKEETLGFNYLNNDDMTKYYLFEMLLEADSLDGRKFDEAYPEELL